MWGPGVLIGCLSIFVTVLLTFLPETAGRELPQTLDDLNNWYKPKANTQYEVVQYKNNDDITDRTKPTLRNGKSV